MRHEENRWNPASHLSKGFKKSLTAITRRGPLTPEEQRAAHREKTQQTKPVGEAS